MKTFLFTIAITIIAFLVIPQVQAQELRYSEAQLRQLEELMERDFIRQLQRNEGRITSEENDRLQEQIQLEMWKIQEPFVRGLSITAAGQIDELRERLYRERWPGRQPGFISEATMVQTLGFAFCQPAGTRASGSQAKAGTDLWSTHLTGSEQIIQQTFNEWKRQIESTYGVMQFDEVRNYYRVIIHSSRTVRRKPAYITIRITDSGALFLEYAEMRNDP